MKITKRQLRRIIKERVGSGQHMSEPAHRRSGLGKNVADVDFPIVVRYAGKSEVLYDEESLDGFLDYLRPGTPYSLDSLDDLEPGDNPVGRSIEMYGEGRVLKEYSEYPSWDDLQHSMDDITEMLDMLAAKYVTSNWLFQPNNEVHGVSAGVARQLEQLYRGAEKLGTLINSGRNRK